MARPCNCNNISGLVYSPKDCRRCWKWHYDKSFRQQHGGDGEISTTCLSLGSMLEEVRDYNNGKNPIKVFECSKYSKCTIHSQLLGTPCCSNCPDYFPVPEERLIHKRNLLFHLYPVRDNDVWRMHVDNWARRIGLFNGKRICTIVYDIRTENEAIVQDYLSRAGFDEIIVTRNDPHLREVATIVTMLEKIKSSDIGEATLYAQGKGVGNNRPVYSAAYTGRIWAEAMHEIYVTWWDRVEPLLRHYPTVGAFKKLGQVWPDSKSTWHYSGSWFWFRHYDLFQRQWRNVEQWWSGIESYPSVQFTKDQAATVLYERLPSDLDLYRSETWRDDVHPTMSTIQQQRDHEVSLTIVVASSGRQTLQRALDSIWAAGVRLSDEVLLASDCGDSADKVVTAAWERARLPGRYLRVGSGHNDWGNHSRNIMFQLASKDVIVNMDDDDGFLPGAFTTIRRAFRNNYIPHAFANIDPDGSLKIPKDEPKGLGTLNMALPNIKSRLGKYGPKYDSDFDCWRDTVHLWNGQYLIVDLPTTMVKASW